MNEREEKAKDEQLKLLENVRNLFNLALLEQKHRLESYKNNTQIEKIFNNRNIKKRDSR